MYDEHLDYQFHKRTILELIRNTSNQIRIFPLVNLKGKKSIFVERLQNDQDMQRDRIMIRRVNYEFVKNGNEMMVIDSRS